MVKIKSTQLPRVAYSYQDLMCIEILVSWFHEPKKYEWVKIEASGSEDLIGLDDVVAKRLDGSFELYQVKFTTDSERKDLALSFSWLLKIKGAGTSLLQKWAQDVKKYRSGGLAIAALQTNRKPDTEFSSCLENGKIIVSKIPDLVMQRLLEQFGNKSEIESFFNQFDFQHSLPEIGSFEDLLRDRLYMLAIADIAWRKGIRPEPQIAVSAWADRHRILSSVSAEPGLWRTDRTPYLRAVMDALSVARHGWIAP